MELKADRRGLEWDGMYPAYVDVGRAPTCEDRVKILCEGNEGTRNDWEATAQIVLNVRLKHNHVMIRAVLTPAQCRALAAELLEWSDQRDDDALIE